MCGLVQASMEPANPDATAEGQANFMHIASAHQPSLALQKPQLSQSFLKAFHLNRASDDKHVGTWLQRING